MLLGLDYFGIARIVKPASGGAKYYSPGQRPGIESQVLLSAQEESPIALVIKMRRFEIII